MQSKLAWISCLYASRTRFASVYRRQESGIVNENNGNEFPKVSSCEEAVMIAKKDADENMDFSTGILTLVEVVMFLVYSKRYLWRNLG